MASIIRFLLLLTIFEVGTIHARKHFRTINLSSLTSDTCEALSQPLKNASTLPLVGRYGPCAKKAHNKSPSLREILIKDKARVAAIQRGKRHKARTDSTDLPVSYGLPFDSYQYIVTMGIGTPPINVSLMFDTASTLSWVQCVPCPKCFKQSGPLFNSDNSSSYSDSSCSSEACGHLDTTKCSSADTCTFELEYADGSVTTGTLATDKLTLTPTEAVQNFIFGCAHKNKGIFGLESGLLALGRSPLALTYQTSASYNRVFSYCLPSSESSTGFLSFGERGTASATPFQYIPISNVDQQEYFYGVDIVGISVAGETLSIQQSVFTRAPTLIDTGTIITRLPPKAYAVVREAFAAGMTDYPTAPAEGILDLCFNIGNANSVTIPEVAFIFKGGTVFNIHPSGILSYDDDSISCMAFAPNELDTDNTIFANFQQRTYEFLYDESAGRIGFAPDICT